MKTATKDKVKRVVKKIRRGARWVFIHRHAAPEAAAVVAALKKAIKPGKSTPAERDELIDKLEALALALKKAPIEEEPAPRAEGSP